MFDTIRQQMQTIAEYLETLGYDEVEVRNITVRPTSLDVVLVALDMFQTYIPDAHKHKQFHYNSITGADLSEIWGQLYALPSRASRELHVLANQLSGIAGMEAQLQNVRVQQMIAPILEAREEMKKLLVAPAEALEPIAQHLDDEVLF